MAKIKVLFWFDVEDFLNDESEEALLRILDLLDERGIKGIFKLVGEKIRVLEQHKRSDIIDRLKHHEIGYHTDFHSMHPVTSEYLEPHGFREGAALFAEKEGSGMDDLSRIIGSPITCYGQPGMAWAPHAYPVLRQWNVKAYLDAHEQVSLHGKPFWYGGLMNLTALDGLMRMSLRDGALEKAKMRFDELCDQQKDEDVGFISIVYHPTEFVFSEFWDDVNFARGKNRPRSEWIKPQFRPEGDMERYLAMLGQFVDYTLSKPNVEYVFTTDLLNIEKSQHRILSKEEIVTISSQITAELSYIVNGDQSLCASELFAVLKQHLSDEERLPELLYGPETHMESDPSLVSAKVADIVSAIQQDIPKVCGFKQLPDYFIVSGKRINPVDVTCTMAAIIREGKSLDDEVTIVRGRLAAADHALDKGDWVKYWRIFAEGFKVPNIVNISKLQTWTLKPALF